MFVSLLNILFFFGVNTSNHIETEQDNALKMFVPEMENLIDLYQIKIKHKCRVFCEEIDGCFKMNDVINSLKTGHNELNNLYVEYKEKSSGLEISIHVYCLKLQLDLKTNEMIYLGIIEKLKNKRVKDLYVECFLKLNEKYYDRVKFLQKEKID